MNIENGSFDEEVTVFSPELGGLPDHNVSGSEQEGIRSLIGRQIRLAEETLSPKEKKKTAVAFGLWGVNSAISMLIGVPTATTSFALWRTRGDPLILALNLVPGALRVGTICVSERLFHVEFSGLSKALSFLPTFPSGYAMPLEIATILGNRSMVLEKIINFSLVSRLDNLKNVALELSHIFRR